MTAEVIDDASAAPAAPSPAPVVPQAAAISARALPRLQRWQPAARAAIAPIGLRLSCEAARAIGVRLPPLRTLAAAIVAVLVFSPIVTAMIGGRGFPGKGRALPALWFVILGAVIALLAGMVFLVIAEALVPSGSVPGPVYVLRATRGRIGRARRYGQISRILALRVLVLVFRPDTR